MDDAPLIFQDIDDLRLLLDQYGNDLVNTLGDQIRAEANQWLADKQRYYTSDAYLEQLEKNAIYLKEMTIADISQKIVTSHYLFIPVAGRIRKDNA
jgi:hypothetical protein